jgi:hypothetical protein
MYQNRVATSCSRLEPRNSRPIRGQFSRCRHTRQSSPAHEKGRTRYRESGLRFKNLRRTYSTNMGRIVSTSCDAHLQSQPSTQLSQHSFSQLQSGQPLQQLPLALQVGSLLLQQPVLAAGVLEDDDQPMLPAASAASNTKPMETLAIMKHLLLESRSIETVTNGRSGRCCIK